jgi:multidrug efflux pump subunit AcrA (membrane-fusion protein)
MFKKIYNLLREFSFKEMIQNISLNEILSFFQISDTIEIKKSLLLVWTIMIFSVFIVLWASLSEINQVVVGNGEVTPESQVHQIQSAVTGPVEKINISLGDKIKKGEILFLIANTQHLQNYQTTFSEVSARRKKVEILEDLFNQGAESEVRLLDEKLLLIEAERRLNTAKLALDYSEIKSSINGTVSQVVAKNIGQVVNTGANLVEIVPENADLRLKVLIQTKDIASVRPNLKAKIAFTSFDMAVYGQFDGIVKTVSASSSIQNEDGIPYYIAIVEVDKNEIKRLKNIEILSGMSASVSIIGDQRTILSYLFNPITKLSKTALRE